MIRNIFLSKVCWPFGKAEVLFIGTAATHFVLEQLVSAAIKGDMTDNDTEKPTSSFWQAGPGRMAPFLLPFVLLFFLLSFSPNFKWIASPGEGSAPFRETPYGGDYLQDWVGGLIAASPPDRELLYSTDYPIQIQHTPQLVGFEWPQENYFPMVYPPYHYWFVSPLSQIPYRWATIGWTTISALVYCLTGWLICRGYEPLRRRPWELMMGMTLFGPAIICLNTGQKSIWILLFFTLTFLLLTRGNVFLSGMVFGLVAVKPHLGVVVGLSMIGKGIWRFVAGAVLVLLAFCVLALWLEPLWLSQYIGVVSKMSDYISIEGYQLHDSHSLWGGLKFLLPDASSSLILYLLLAACLAVFLIVGRSLGFREKFNPKSKLFSFQFSILVLATVLISPHFYTYDLTLLVLPLALLLGTFAERTTVGDSGIGKRAKHLGELDWSRRWVQACGIAPFVLAGFFPMMNLYTGLPCGVILLAVFLAALSIYTSKLSQQSMNELAAMPKQRVSR
jgi:hypothetical protein